MSNDRITVWAVVGSIIVGFFASLVATIGFAWIGKEVPAPIGHLLDVSFGALATLLAQTRSGEREKGRVEEGEKG
ncbi:MAG: hypothetical protein JO316_17290 [Abitibacteriaceae bacterium]|nr:hypothetical protein [Abditibacteriaceae bacterium]